MNNNTKIVERVLALLRQYGWETGYKKLEAELHAQGLPPEGNEVREFFLGWMAAERGNFAEAVRQFQMAGQVPSLAGWALLGEAFVAMRGKDFGSVKKLLGAARENCVDDPQLVATICHIEGASLFHLGASDEAIPLLTEAMKLYGPAHFGFGRVLDTLGMVYAHRDNFQAAREFFGRALELKHPEDSTGRAITHGQLGRLYLDWGYLDKAQSHFDEDLKIARQIGDEFGKAMMYNHLGQVCLMRGEHEAALNRPATAREQWEASAGWLASAANLSLERKWPIVEGYARKDQARLALVQGKIDEAETHITAADDIFKSRGYLEGLAHVNRVRGLLQCRQKRWDNAQASFRAALRHFEETRQPAEVARTRLAIARAAAAAGEPRPLVSSAFLEALSAAEGCRRAQLIRQIEDDLKLHDAAVYCNCVYRRVRGREVMDDAVSLIDGIRESATVLFLDLQGSTELFRFRDPAETLMTLNEMMANLAAVLRKHQGQVNGYRGDGFLALFRGSQDAVRGVEAALDLQEAMNAFNEPRSILGLPPWITRIGINSGDMFMGNVGTYDKLDFSAVGTTVNLAARLEGVAEGGMPCIGRGTYEKVQGHFRFTADVPRTIALKGLGPTQVWDVVGRLTSKPPAQFFSEHYRAETAMENLAPTGGSAALGSAYPGSDDTGFERKLFAIRRLNPTMWEFAFNSNKAQAVGKHLAGFVYLALLLGEPDREMMPADLIRRGNAPKRAIAPSDSEESEEFAMASAVSGAMGNDDKLDSRAIREYRHRVAELTARLKLKENPEERKELAAIESQLRSAIGIGGKRVGVGANRLKLDYNAVKKAIDKALAELSDHHLLDLATHLSTHVELSTKGCRYRNSARLEWDVAP